MFRHGLVGLVFIICILTSFHQVWSQNCVLVGEKLNLTFNYNPKESGVFWRRNGVSLFATVVDTSSGSGCQGGNTFQGYTFYCEDGGATYIIEITSALRDKDVSFDTDPAVGSLVYTPIVDLDQCPNEIYNCNQTGEMIENFTLSCESSCTQNHYIILQYQLESGTVEDLENPVNATIVKCHPDADLYKSTFSYTIDSNQFNSPTKRVKLIVKMILGGRNEKEVFETNYFYIGSTGPCLECTWCIPVLISCAAVIITGIIIAILRYVKWDELKGMKLYCFYFWCVLLVICLIILIIYVAVIELDCCDKKTCNGFAIAEIVIDILVILVYIFSLKKQCTKKGDNKKQTENSSTGIKLKPRQ